MTTPREDARVALDWWANVTSRKYNPNGMDPESVLMAGSNLAATLRVALGAEAETPDMRAAVDAGYREGYRAAEADIAAHIVGHWVDLASPETAETLARAIYDGWRATGYPVAPFPPATVAAILAAMRETRR